MDGWVERRCLWKSLKGVCNGEGGSLRKFEATLGSLQPACGAYFREL